MATDNDPYESKIIAGERDAGMKWSDRATCGHTRADMLAAQGLGKMAAMGGTGIVNLDTRCEQCDVDQLECEAHWKELDEVGIMPEETDEEGKSIKILGEGKIEVAGVIFERVQTFKPGGE